MRRALAAMAVLLYVRGASADEVLHSYVAPPVCPDAPDLRAQLASARRQVDVTIDAPLGKTGRFTVSGNGTREVQGKDCPEVLAQITFGIGLALDVPREQAPKPTPAPAPPRATPVVDAPERDAPPPASHSWSDRRELSIGVMTGVSHTSNDDDGLAFGAQLLHRRGLLALGGVLDYTTNYYEQIVSGGAQLGVSLPAPPWLHVDLLGTLGARGYAARASLFSEPGHDAKTIGFVGARTTITYDFSLLSVGISGSAESDLAPVWPGHPVTPRLTFGPFAAVRFDL